MTSISRRQFLGRLSLGVLGVLGATLLPREVWSDTDRPERPRRKERSQWRLPARPRCR